MPYADLHVHSSESDGMLSCAQIIERAERHGGLHAIAISDHDTLEGARKGQAANARGKVICIPAVEISTKTDGRDVHMLAYYVDIESADLRDLFDASRAKREARTLKMADNLRKAGYSISADDLLNTGKVVNRPLLARLLIERGYAHSVDECFSSLIGKKSPHYVEVSYPDTVEVIHLVRETGAFAFVAHPAQYRIVDLIGAFAKEGMTGLEAYHTMQTPQQSAQLVDIAHDLGLAISGGSDWHGDGTHGADLGSAGLEQEDFELFLQACTA